MQRTQRCAHPITPARRLDNHLSHRRVFTAERDSFGDSPPSQNDGGGSRGSIAGAHLSGKGGSVEDCRACIPGSGSAGQTAGEGRTESRQRCRWSPNSGRTNFKRGCKSVQGQLDQARATLNALQLGERPEERLRREAQLRAAEAKLANAKTEFDRYGRLVKTSAVSRAEYELSETAYRVAQEEQKAALQLVEKGGISRKEDIDAQQAQVRAIEGRLAEANIQLRDSTLRAPYDGVVAQRFVEENQTISANKPVVTFQNVDEIDVVADVPEAAIAADVRSAAITQMVAEFSTAPGRQFPVRIKEVAASGGPDDADVPSPRRHEGASPASRCCPE